MAMGTKGTKGSSDPSAMARHSRESGNPAPLAFDSMKSLDPRLRGDDGNPSDPATSTALPRLRFPEFRGSGAWNLIKLGNVLKFQVGFPFPSKGFTEEGHGIRLIRNRDLRSNEKPIYYVDAYNADFVVFNGDILVGMDGDFTPCVWDGGDALLNQRVGRVLPKAENHKRFLLYFLTAHLKAIEDSTARTTVKHLSHSDVEKICEPLPCGREQQKIADCLTSLDEVIAAQGRKVEALKAHKRGLMQQLFPREGETRPRLRFPEFRNELQWSTKGLGRLAKIQTGKKDANEGAIDGAYPFFTCAESHIYSHSYSFDAEAILIAGNANVGQTKYFKGKFEAYQRTYVLTGFTGVLVPYLYEFLSANLPPALLVQVQTSAMSYIRLPMLEDFQVSIPSSLGEQQRIADCLSSLDTRIAAETRQLTALKTHKHGLMQQLFPAPEAASA